MASLKWLTGCTSPTGPALRHRERHRQPDDGFRSRFIHEHLAEIANSALPIERHYYWSFMDNWEWLEGESARFGLDPADLRDPRTNDARMHSSPRSPLNTASPRRCTSATWPTRSTPATPLHADSANLSPPIGNLTARAEPTGERQRRRTLLRPDNHPLP